MVSLEPVVDEIGGRNSRMTMDTTSPPMGADGAASGKPAIAATMRDEWRRFAGFLRRPVLPEEQVRVGGSGLAAIFRMLGLDLLLMAGLGVIAMLVIAAGVELPETALAGMEIEIGLALAVVIVAPLVEEVLFRGWLSGKPGRVAALLAILGGAALGGVLTATGPQSDVPGPAMLATGGGIVLAVILFIGLRNYDAPQWYRRAFPIFFWLSTLAFAFIHVFNFEGAEMLAALPLVLPQFITGSILGYMRVHYGLWSSIVLHMLHNGAALSLAYTATELAA
ncbi:CPBP family glutamic-type intramembrane protease [Alteriqipengyuania sp. WL0013]|uniref:CPBP family glutamic-type intramembrane protease n=1 Tax=Alteriqipengyuania sp. WL0013 TaxID=3110773 RepID=UPI002C320081|nr:CPBP family glutamic-type intramembrane protease [Alteriqipengyuania sp. WL0013]MEB3416560.1 CPBP family glutamic-type intramembrane protease [Alteriqipengyuania sp. WL0013]